MWGGSPGFSASLGAVMVGREIGHTNLHPLLVVGFDAVQGKSDGTVTVIDKDNGKTTQGFDQSLIHLETGFGLHYGGSTNFSGEFIFAPGAVFIDQPRRFKQDPTSTVALGLSWRLES